MVEPDVALTDFAIALACGAFAVVLARGGRREPVRRAFIGLFAATGAAALVGGIAHGFFDLSIGTPVVHTLWFLTMALTGAAGAALWLLVAALVAPSRLQPLLRWVIVVEWLAYLAWVVWVDPSFIVAIVQYSAPALIVLVVFVWRAQYIGSAALALTFVAGALQHAGYTPTDTLTHNAFFHLLQLIALTGLFLTARRIDEVKHG